MRLWEKASSMLKDRNSIWLANLTRRSALRNPEIEKAVIRATIHHPHAFDHRNIDRVCRWIRLSPLNLKPVLWSVSNRMEKTSSWVVALKGLYLMHTVTNSRIPCVRMIGRLPFDLSNFKAGSSSSKGKARPYSSFVRAYFAFLNQKSILIFQHTEERTCNGNNHDYGVLIKQELVLLQKLQGLIDLLVQIKPHALICYEPLILDVMDGVIIEIYDIYSRICRGIAVVFMNIYSGGNDEAEMALNVVRKATRQGEDLTVYFEFCKEIGVMNASEELPVIDRVPEEGIRELEQIVNGVCLDVEEGSLQVKNEEKGAVNVIKEGADYHHEKKMAMISSCNEVSFSKNELRTVIITDKWERFDDDDDVLMKKNNPFDIHLIDYHVQEEKKELPDLIIF